MRRKAMMGVLAGALLLLPAGGAAVAADQIDCPNRDGGRCVGTAADDTMLGRAVADDMAPRTGATTP